MGGRLRILHRLINSVEHKQCFFCKDWFPLKLFGNNKKSWDGLRVDCKKCDDEKCKKYYANLTKEGKEKKAKNRSRYYRKNKDKLTREKVLYRKANPDKVRKWRKNYKVAHPEKAREYNKRRRSTPKGHLSINISKSMGKALKGNKAGRHWEDIVGYTLDQLYRRLRYTMPKGYEWQDYLDGKLHIDHKIPVSVFNFEKPEDDDFQKCFALKNLQLLPAIENIIKSNKLDKHFQPSLKF